MKKNRRRGMSLVELCISIVILTVVMAGAFRIFHQGFRIIRKARLRTVGLTLCQGIIEHFSDWEELQDFTEVEDPVPPVPGDYEVAEECYPEYADSEVRVTLNGIGYDCELTIFGTEDNIKELASTVSWDDHGKHYSVSLHTLKADY